ncbi:probable cytochrome P450 6a20 [Diorhabda carinulata]|uniref:probable cytochrome P450 6a20 n=1 Tax=Diorhabda carinulata TaxID=1163345 RepID=UPI0025A1D833|nr:probable cytochrome P450 6a20 [Diorhabda carinulata]XP_057660427.1 probable cytochrome P450 6a20 [Diorhabda carinulata]
MVVWNVVLSIITLAVVVYLYLKWHYNYWKRKGLYQIEPELVYGNIKEFVQQRLAFADQFTKLYNQLKSKGLKHGGIYLTLKPTYMPIDLDIIKNILQRDFPYMMNHGHYTNEEADPLTGHLFALENEKWRKMRTKLTPTFTSGKMKMMFPTMIACTKDLVEVLEDNARIQDPVNVKEVASGFTIDVIGSVAFGIDCCSLKNPDSEFRKFGKKIFMVSPMRRIKHIISTAVPRWVLLKLGYKQTEQEIEDFFMSVVGDTVKYREENNIYRKDFMHLLLQLKNRGRVTDDEIIFNKEDEKNDAGHFITLNELVAQCFVFFLAGFETSATTITFVLLEIALAQEVQDKLRDEIRSIWEKHHQITYEAVMEMHYLEMVIQETLRKHPPVPSVPRVSTKEYAVPGTDIILATGTKVHIPVHAIQNDPEYYPEPDKFIPERFTEENKSKRHPLSFLPFGEGPRLCIGARFGMLQIKVAVASIINTFKVTINDKTKLPIRYTTSTFVPTVEGDVWLDFHKLK